MPEFVDLNGARTFFNEFFEEFQAELDKTDWQQDGATFKYGKVYENVSPLVEITGINSTEGILLDTDTKVVTITSAACDSDTQISYSGEGYSFYLDCDNVSIIGLTSAELITVAGDYCYLNANGGADTINVQCSNSTILSGADKDALKIINSSNIYIDASGNDDITINGGTSNTIKADGNNIFLSGANVYFETLNAATTINAGTAAYGQNTIASNISNGTITINGNTIGIAGVTGDTLDGAYQALTVTYTYGDNQTSSTTLGDLLGLNVNPEWRVINNKLAYGVIGSDPLVTIEGLNTETTGLIDTLTSNTSDSTVTIPTVMIPLSGVTYYTKNGYTVVPDKNSEEEEANWKVAGNTFSYISGSIGYTNTAPSNGVPGRIEVTGNAKTEIDLAGLKDTVTVEQIGSMITPNTDKKWCVVGSSVLPTDTLVICTSYGDYSILLDSTAKIQPGAFEKWEKGETAGTIIYTEPPYTAGWAAVTATTDNSGVVTKTTVIKHYEAKGGGKVTISGLIDTIDVNGRGYVSGIDIYDAYGYTSSIESKQYTDVSYVNKKVIKIVKDITCNKSIVITRSDAEGNVINNNTAIIQYILDTNDRKFEPRTADYWGTAGSSSISASDAYKLIYYNKDNAMVYGYKLTENGTKLEYDDTKNGESYFIIDGVGDDYSSIIKDDGSLGIGATVSADGKTISISESYIKPAATGTTIKAGTMEDNDITGYNFSILSATTSRLINTFNGVTALDHYSASGTDTLVNYATSLSISHSGNGFIRIENYSDYVTIIGGDGKDTISNSGNYVSIDGGSGYDSISNTGNYVTIDGGSGNDTIRNTGSSVSIYGGNGADYISNTSNNVTIDGGSGKDTISNTGSNVSINGGNDADSIKNSGDNVSISLGNGNEVMSTVLCK